MSHRYPRSYSSGPRHLEDEDAPPSLITPYQSGTGTPEDEEEMELLQQLGRGQEAVHASPTLQVGRQAIERQGELSGQDELPQIAEQDEMADLLRPAMEPSRSARAAWFRDQLQTGAATDPENDELPRLLAQGQAQNLIPGNPHPALDELEAMPKSQQESRLPLKVNDAADESSGHGSPLRPRLDYTPAGPKPQEKTPAAAVPPDLDWTNASPSPKTEIPGADGPGPRMEEQQQPAKAPLPGAAQTTAQDQESDEESPKEAGPSRQALENSPKKSAEHPLTTTIRIGDYPAYTGSDYEPEEIDKWNKAFRTNYGQFAVDAARKNGVPARLLAALSANEMAAGNWNAINAFADRNTLWTRSVGPLQISANTALKYRLVPVDNEFHNATRAETWQILHDPDFRSGNVPPHHGVTPAQRLGKFRDIPYPNNANGPKIIHDHLDNPATSFQAGAKLLDVYLKKLTDDFKSGAYLNYSKDFQLATGIHKKDSDIRKDLEILASGDKEVIFNLQCGKGLAKAAAMMWNNDAGIVNVDDLRNESPNAYNHGANMVDQQERQNDLIPDDKDATPQINHEKDRPLSHS